MTKDIAIYGAGGLGRELFCLLRQINEIEPRWNFIGYIDDGKAIGSTNEYGAVLGGMDFLNAYTQPLDVVMGIGTPTIVCDLVHKISNANISFPNLIAPDTKFLDKQNVVMGRGNIFAPGCFVSIAIRIGDFNLFNGSVSIGHDVTTGNFNAFMPGVRISGEVSIGNCNFFGVDSIVLQQLTIGSHTVIGANAAIIKNTNDHCTYIGTPAVVLKY